MKFNAFKTCPYRYYSKGYSIPNSNSYPANSWGKFLPGDEPGYKCSKLEIGCDPEMDIYLDECFRMKLITDKVLKQDIDEPPFMHNGVLWKDEYLQQYYSPDLGDWVTSTEIVEKSL